MNVVAIELFAQNNVVATRGTRFHVDFNFCCHLFVYEYYGDVLLRINERPSIRRSSIHIGFDQFIRHDDSLEMIDQELRGWPILDGHENDRRELIEVALAAANELLDFMPPQHNVLVIPFRIEIACNRIVDENHAMELAARLSMQEVDSGTVPATDSSIESLEIKTTTSRQDGESCSICLEDFNVGCEVVSMPCSHIFHEDCIKKWLKSSHYCPICRFEMPHQYYVVKCMQEFDFFQGYIL